MNMKEVEKTYGHVLINEERQIVGYLAGASENGMCFKDENARGDEMAYIPEYAEWNKKFMMPVDVAILENGAYTYNDLIDVVLEFFEEYELTLKQAEYIVGLILSDVSWEFSETYLAEMDIEDIIISNDDGIFTESQKRMCEK